MYFDSIFIFNKSEDDHLAHQRKVLEALRTNSLYLNLKKYDFLIKELVFLGFVINSKGIAVDQRKIQAVTDMQTPKNVMVRGVFICTLPSMGGLSSTLVP